MDFINSFDLTDLECKGCTLTWTNKRDVEEFVKERLEQVLCSIEWRVLYSGAKSNAISAIGLDHSQLFLSLESIPMKKKWEFKFEAFWLEDVECKQIITGL